MNNATSNAINEYKKPTGMRTLIIILYVIMAVSMNGNLYPLDPDTGSETISSSTLALACNLLLLGAAIWAYVYTYINSKNQ